MKKNNRVDIVGCGFVGKKILHNLNDANIKPRCFVQNQASKEACEQLGAQVYLCSLDRIDLALSKPVASAFSNRVIAYLVPPQAEGDIDKRLQQFIAILKSLPLPPLKIILISTTGVYGDCKGQWIDESWPVNPRVSRSKRRLSAETQLINYCNEAGIPYVIFRVAGIYAADKLPVKRITSGEPIVRVSDSGYTNRIHVDDLSRFCVEALTRNVNPGIYNGCDGQPSTMNDYFIQVADALKLPRSPEISLQEAQSVLSKGMLSYLAESKRISNKKLMTHFNTTFNYPNLSVGLNVMK